MINNITIAGNLTQDPVLRVNKSTGAQFCVLRLANNRFYNMNNQRVQQTTYVDVICNGSSAENHAKYLRKGSRVVVQGRLDSAQWSDRGATRTQHRIVGLNVQYMDPANSSRAQTTEETVDTSNSQEEFEDVPI